MTEQELIDLGFECCQEDGLSLSDDAVAVASDPDYYYYYYHIANGLGLISNETDSLLDGEWFVEVFDTDPLIRFNTKKEVLDFLAIINTGLSNSTKHEKKAN